VVRHYASYPAQKPSPLFLLLKQPHIRRQAHPNAAQSPLQKRLTVRDRPWTIDEPFDFCAALDADPDQLLEEASGFAWHEAASGSPPAGRARFLPSGHPFPDDSKHRARRRGRGTGRRVSLGVFSTRH